jgi:hypothetical protein
MASFGCTCAIFLRINELIFGKRNNIISEKKLILSNKINTVKLLIALCKEIPEDFIAAIHNFQQDSQSHYRS